MDTRFLSSKTGMNTREKIVRTGSSSYPVPGSKAATHNGKTIDEALIRIREVIGLCREDSQLNTFVGFREVEIVFGA